MVTKKQIGVIAKMNRNKPAIMKYIVTLVISSSVGMIAAAFILNFIGSLIGFGSQGILVVILFSFPFVQFSTLYGFYKGLKKHFDLKA